MKLFSKCLATGLCLSVLAGFTACSSDDDWKDVDGKTPSLTLASVHEQTEAGRQIKIIGQVADADGISTIDLVCHELNLNKRIDIIDIYGEPLKTYDLDYAFQIQPDQEGESFEIDVVITDIGGRKDTQVVKVTLDGDFTYPVFTMSPDKEVTVLIKSVTTFNLQFEVSDNRIVDYVTIDLKDISKGEENATDVAGFPRRLEGNGTGEFKFAEKLVLPSEAATMLATITAYDKAANEDAHATSITSVVTVSELLDFPTIYLCDVEEASELNSDLFGVPVAMDHIGAYKYRVRYYNEKAGTKICFLAQKTDFGPICFGPDPNDPNSLGDDPAEVGRITLDKADRYYMIDVDTWNRTYKLTDYAVADAANPVMYMHVGENDLNTWWETNPDKDADIWWQEFYFGPATGPGDILARMTQDSKNPNIFVVEEWNLNAGQEFEFMIHNWHSHGWWNFTAWRAGDSDDASKFEYYGNYIPATSHYAANDPYFKMKYMDLTPEEFNFMYPAAGGSFDLNKWGDESYRKNFVADKRAKVKVATSGTYKMIFDAHTERARLVPVK